METVGTILQWILILIGVMSASDFLPKRNLFRRVATVSKVHQIWTAVVIGLGALLVEPATWWWILPMIVCIALNNLRSLFPYTRFHRPEVPIAKHEDLHLLSLNVRQANRDFKRSIDFLLASDADIIALTEVDQGWTDALQALHEKYPFHCQQPQDNTYGMAVYSKQELISPKVEYLTKEGIPSIHTYIHIAGVKTRLVVLHPEPPISIKRLKEKDLEILKVSRNVMDADVPYILCGDLNDVGWSYASRYMCEMTELYDPRIGRGLYNTYNAKIPVFQYPIDHFFISAQFAVYQMKVHEACGSDHYPVSLKLGLTKE